MKLTALSAAIPQTRVENLTAGARFGTDVAEKIVANTGIKTRYVADKATCASDLCVAAAEALFSNTSIERSSVDAIVFVTQTPDFMIPSTSNLIQSRLGLSENMFAMDVSQGCSGFTHGLLIADGLLSTGRINRVLLLCGDTLSKTVSADDQATALLFGDAGTAAIIDPGDCIKGFVSGSDGTGNSVIGQKCGYRNGYETIAKLSPETYQQSEAFRLTLDGGKVFTFTIKRVPRMIKDVLLQAGLEKDEVDAFVFHQANKFMLDYLSKKMKLPADRIPCNLDRYGNTSSASIPLTLFTDCRELLSRKATLVLAGFGVGLNWSSAVLQTTGVELVELVEV